jgi:hypothetical protein
MKKFHRKNKKIVPVTEQKIKRCYLKLFVILCYCALRKFFMLVIWKRRWRRRGDKEEKFLLPEFYL